MWILFFIIDDNVGVFIIDSIPYSHNENTFKRHKILQMWIRFYTEDKIRVSIVDSIPYCHAKMLVKGAKKQQQTMWLRLYKEVKSGVSIIDTVILKRLPNNVQNSITKNVATFLYRGQCLIGLVFHTVIRQHF